MINNIKAAIFDLDGTLIDSMGVWVQIDIDYIKEIGYTEPVDLLKLKKDINHLSFDNTAKYFKEKFNIPQTSEEIGQRWNEMASDKYKNEIKLKEGVLEFLTELKNSGVKIGLATSNSYELATASLKSNNIFDLFDDITITSEVSRGKNHPDVYLLSASRLNVEPKDIIVFEDIPTAVEGAKKGGFKVIGVHDSYSSHHNQEMMDKSDMFIESYTELLINN